MNKHKHYKAPQLRYVMTCVLSVLMVALVIATPGCAEEKPLPSPEPAIPPHFTTYTDEAQLFSISFPPDWEPALSYIPGLEESTREALRGIELDVPPEEYTTVFFGGLPSEEGYRPNVNILVGRAFGSTVEEEFEASMRGMKEMSVGNYQIFEQIKTVVGGREAMIIDHAFTLPDMPRIRAVQMIIVVGKISWGVNCGTVEEEFATHQQTINQVVRSFRILG